MLNNKDIGTVITVTPIQQEILYLVRNIGSIDAQLLLFSDAGVPLHDDTIDTLKPASLFFDSAGNFYSLNVDKKIAQYNFETKELDELPGQSAIPWSKIFIYRLDDGSFMTSDFQYDPIIADTVIVMERYSIDGTLLEQTILTGLPYGTIGVGELHSFSTNGAETTISFQNDVYVGVGSYSASGMLIDFIIDSTIPDETGGTLYENLLYTMASEVVMLIRDLDTGDIINEIPITEYNVGSIGRALKQVDDPFKGLLLSIDSTNPTTDTIADEAGNPVLFLTPGRKYIEMTTQQNLDAFLDGEVESMLVDGEVFSITNISTTGTDYQVSLQTPEYT